MGLFYIEVSMILFLSDTTMGYGAINALLTKHIGESGPDTWQTGADTFEDGYKGFVEIHDSNSPEALFIKLIWS